MAQYNEFMIDERVKLLAQGRNFAALTTLFGDGRPQTQMMWVDADDDHVLVNTEIHRVKYKNVEKDSRVTVTIIDSENPYHYVEVRGRVVEKVLGAPALVHINALANKYTGKDYGATIKSERVILKITTDEVCVR